MELDPSMGISRRQADRGIYTWAGWASVASSVLGLVACGFLVTALRLRTTADPHTTELLFGAHDIGAIFQYLCLIPVAVTLRQLSHSGTEGLGRPFLTVGVTALVSTAFLLLVEFIHFDWLPWYMVPQGIFGGWLMVVSWRMAKTLPWSLTGLGLIVGLGLVLVATFPLGYTLWVDPSVPESVANEILHQVVKVGSYLGVFPLPFWTVLLGAGLLRAKDH